MDIKGIVVYHSCANATSESSVYQQFVHNSHVFIGLSFQTLLKIRKPFEFQMFRYSMWILILRKAVISIDGAVTIFLEKG